MPEWSLCYIVGCWGLERRSETRSNAFIADEHLVSPSDLTCFKINGSDVFGLATLRTYGGDRIWRFQETNLAFVVRNLSPLNPLPCNHSPTPHQGAHTCEIVGRTIRFRADRTMFDRLSLETLSTTQLLTPHEIMLQPADLFDLAYWADTRGAAPSLFGA